jgi:hypothetical protein
VRDLISKYKDYKIVHILGAKQPIESSVQWLANIISSGKYEQAKSKLGYDNFFHVYLILRLEDGTKLKLEKNEVINIEVITGLQKNTGSYNIGDTNIRLGDFLSRGQQLMGPDKYFDYDPFNNNCQIYLLSLLKANGLINKDISDFFGQDAQTVSQELGVLVSGLFKGVIKSAQIYDLLRYGYGMFGEAGAK